MGEERASTIPKRKAASKVNHHRSSPSSAPNTNRSLGILQNENKNAEADDRLIAWLNEMFGKIKSDAYHELIGEDEFSTLIRKTINKITVYPTELKVELFDGNTFAIQRKLVDKRGRTVIDYGTVENYVDNGIVKPTVKFGDGEKILETDFYKIMY